MYPGNTTPKLELKAYEYEEVYFTSTLSILGVSNDEQEETIHTFPRVVALPNTRSLVGLGLTGVDKLNQPISTLLAPVRSLAEVQARCTPNGEADTMIEQTPESLQTSRTRWGSEPIGFYEMLTYGAMALMVFIELLALLLYIGSAL